MVQRKWLICVLVSLEDCSCEKRVRKGRIIFPERKGKELKILEREQKEGEGGNFFVRQKTICQNPCGFYVSVEYLYGKKDM